MPLSLHKYTNFSPQVQHQCLVTLHRIFNHENNSISFYYIQALGPRVVELLSIKTSGIDSISPEDYALITQGLTTFESLITKADPDKRKF